MQPSKSVSDAATTIVCNGCSCLCDDIQPGGASEFENACEKGLLHLQQLRDHAVDLSFEYAGQSIDIEKAVSIAAEILQTAKAPLVAGIESLGARAQQLAVNIGRSVGASIDTSLSNAGRGPVFSLQREGAVTATLGEIAGRAELVVFWYCDPTISHPRFVERFCRRENQKTIFVSGDPTRASAAAQVCEMLSRGLAIDGDVKRATGQELSKWRDLVEHLKSCDYAAIIFDPQPFDSCFDSSVDSLTSLAKQLNASARVVVNPLTAPSNSISAENVLAWSTGFPVAVNTAHRNRSHFLEYSGERLLASGENDASLIFVGRDGAHATGLDQASWRRLLKKPLIFVGETSGIRTHLGASVSTKSAPKTLNIETGNQALLINCDVYSTDDWARMDDVLLPFQQIDHGSGAGKSGGEINDFLRKLCDLVVVNTDLQKKYVRFC